jgi:hypothetical protein
MPAGAKSRARMATGTAMKLTVECATFDEIEGEGG